MKSLREAARTGGINDVPLSARSLAQRSGLMAPVSLTDLVGALAAPPPAPAGPVEEAKFHGEITTPTGTALRGTVDLTLRNDGSYAAHFHMRATGVPNFDYQVRAIFTASNGVAFALQQSGHVEGTGLNPFDKPGHDDHDITGSHPFIKDFWADMKTGSLAVTKEYKPTGVIGVIQDIASVVLEITAHAAGAGLGVVIGLGAEIGKVFGDLGVGAGFGVIAGVVVFASGGTLVLALPVGVAVGAVTNALVNQKRLSEWPEAVTLAEKVFGDKLPPADKIWLTNLAGIGGRAFTMPGTGNGDIYLNLGDAFDNPLGPAKHYPMNGQLLIHELTHAWQIKYATFLPGLVCKAVVTQAHNEFGGSAYDYGPPGPPWARFNPEQQASIVDQWFAAQRVQGRTPMNVDDPYYMYIRDNIRAGRT